MEENKEKKRSRKWWILLLLLLILLLPLCFRLWSDSRRAVNNKQIKTDTDFLSVKDSVVEGLQLSEELAHENETGEATLIELLRKDGQHICSINVVQSGVTATGTIYNDGNNARGDFNVKAIYLGGFSVKAYVIRKTDDFYAWINISDDGYKRVSKSPDDPFLILKNKGFDSTIKMKYECEDTRPDSGIYSLPVGVTFKNI